MERETDLGRALTRATIAEHRAARLTDVIEAIAMDECVCPHPNCGHELAQAALSQLAAFATVGQ